MLLLMRPKSAVAGGHWRFVAYGKYSQENGGRVTRNGTKIGDINEKC